MSSPTTYSLLELNQYIRRVISLNFEEPLWIECEIGQASLSRGHWYLDLLQKDGDTIVAQCQAALWANVYFFIKRKSPIPPEDILKQGMSVKLKVNVDYHERFGLKLIIEDLDSSFTIGVLEMQRQAILKEVRERDLLRRNAGVYLSPVIQRLAVISSGRAAGWKDFVKHIEDNAYGYHISVTLFEAAMQGQQVETEVLACLEKIRSEADQYDAVAIIRGGGARTDLAVFDNLPMAIRVAYFPLPIFIGIGHEIDQSVLDLVAYQSLKTPTAVADFVVEHNAGFELQLNEINMLLREEISLRLRAEHHRIHQLAHGLNTACQSRIKVAFQKLEHLRFLIRQAGKHKVQLHRNRMEHLETLLEAIHPDRVLARGYSITSHDGKTISRADQAAKGMLIQTTFQDGSIKSIVE